MLEYIIQNKALKKNLLWSICMSNHSGQELRLIKFVAEMKKNNFPNAESFAKLLRKLDLEENISCACCARTIGRDIERLKDYYKAPIEYDHSRHGYYLKRAWDFDAPVLTDDILSMNLLGTKLASDILPEPLKREVDLAMEKSLTQNNSEFFDEAMIESLLCASGIKAVADPEVFKKVFDGWRCHQVLKFAYTKPNSEHSVRTFEPHIIAFHRGVWYAKGYEYQTKNIKVYAIQRMANVEFAMDIFDTDKKLLEHTRRNGLFEYPKIDGVRLHCDASIAFYIYEHQKAKKFKIDRQDDGSLIVTLRPATEHEVIRWVLGEAGKIKVLYPEELRKKTAQAALAVWEKNKD
jgi:predicted DNA-binding transcriptional regulator YafY